MNLSKKHHKLTQEIFVEMAERAQNFSPPCAIEKASMHCLAARHMQQMPTYKEPKIAEPFLIPMPPHVADFKLHLHMYGPRYELTFVREDGIKITYTLPQPNKMTMSETLPPVAATPCLRCATLDSELVTLQLCLRVTYDPKGTPIAYLERLLDNLPFNAEDDGSLTGDTAAEVQAWDSEVKVLDLLPSDENE